MPKSDEKTNARLIYKNAFLFIRHHCVGNMTRLYPEFCIFVSMNVVVNVHPCTKYKFVYMQHRS